MTKLAQKEKQASVELTESLTEAILKQDRNYVQDPSSVYLRRRIRLDERNLSLSQESELLLNDVDLSDRAKRAFEEAQMKGGSDWLTSVPLERLGLDMTGQMFRDAISLRMGLPFSDPLPTSCPSCGSRFGDEEEALDHLLICKKGGFIMQRHDAVVRVWEDYLKAAGAAHVVREPYLVPVRGEVRRGTNTGLDARADIMARSLFQTGRELYGDTAVIDTGARCYRFKTSAEVLEAHEVSKKAEYGDRVALMGDFVPLVCSIYGTLAPEAHLLAARAARQVDPESEERGAVVDLHRVMIQVGIIKATSLCLRGRSLRVPPNSKSLLDPILDRTGALIDAGLRDFVE